MTHIRPISLGIFTYNGKVLLGEYETETANPFCRPLGGGVEFGETSLDALHREIKEELDHDIHSAKLLTVIENIFYKDGQGHEIVFLYHAKFIDVSIYAQNIVFSAEKPDTVAAKWIPIADFKNGTKTLYPLGIVPYLD